MSRHHILPPIVYTPAPPKPKETRRRRSILGASATDEAEETEEAGDTKSARKTSPLPQHARPVEPTERRVPSPNGKLSDGTLKAMLEVQEQDASQGVGTSTTKPGK